MKEDFLPRSTLEVLVQRLRDDRHEYVDARLWQNDWSDSWVSYSDILGFANRCERSEPAVVNAIVRFHRSVAAAREACAETAIRLFQFTDAVFAVSPDLLTMLRFTSTLQHHCLAHNLIIIENKAHPLAHHLLLVRITVSHGRVLTLPEPAPSKLRTIGVSAGALLAGPAVVEAYRIEKKTAGAMVAFPTHLKDLVAEAGLSIRGRLARPRKILESWVNGGGEFVHDEVTDFPWTLLRPVQGEPALWADSLDESKRKLTLLLDCCDLLGGEFLVKRTPLEVAKHRAGIIRHITETAQRLGSQKGLTRWTEAKLRERLVVKGAT